MKKTRSGDDMLGREPVRTWSLHDVCGLHPEIWNEVHDPTGEEQNTALQQITYRTQWHVEP